MKTFWRIAFVFLFTGFSFFTSSTGVFLVQKFTITEGGLGTYFGVLGVWIVITQGFILRVITKKYTIVDTRTNEKIVTENLAQTCKSLNISSAGLLGKYKRGKPYIHWKIENVEKTITTKHYK
jgi:hypothetical protein